MSIGGDRDLVIISLPGVQQFIAEARTTRDLVHASRIVSDLVKKLVEGSLGLADMDLVMPSGVDGSVSNKMVFLAKAGAGPDAATALVKSVSQWWASRIEEIVGATTTTTNTPKINWVCVAADGRSYSDQWRIATTSLADRRKLRDFTPLQERASGRICSVTGRWPALPQAPGTVPSHGRNESLSAVAWAKRRWSTEPVPSTSVIATAPYRAWIARHIDEDGVRPRLLALRAWSDSSLPKPHEYPLPKDLTANADAEGRWISRAGQWVQDEAWTVENVQEAREAVPARQWRSAAESASEGRLRAKELAEVVSERGGPAPARYLALIAQDLDDMGKRLSGAANSGNSSDQATVDGGWHRQLSQQLTSVAAGQCESIESTDHLGKVIYAGGDDLLALVPASRALAAAQAAQAELANGPDLPTASTAIFFFHQHGNLSDAVRSVHELLTRAKSASPAKHGLAVGFARRSGNAYSLARPWTATTGQTAFIDLLEDLRTATSRTITPGLLGELRQRRRELESLITVSQKPLELELRRLVGRHLAAAPGEAKAAREAAVIRWSDALVEVALRSTTGPDLVGAMRIGLFLRQECR